MSFKLRLTLFYSFFLALALACASILIYSLTRQALYQALEKQLTEAADSYVSNASPIDVLRLRNNAYFESILYLEYKGVPTDGQDIVNKGLANPLNLRPNPRDIKIWHYLNVDDVATLLEDYHSSDGASARMNTEIVLEDGTKLLGHLYIGEIEIPVSLPNFIPALTPEQFFDLLRLGILNTGLGELPQEQPVLVPSLAVFAVPTDEIATDLAKLRRALMIASAATFFLFVLTIWFLSRQVISPLKRMVRAADKISSEDLSQRVPLPPNRDELRELADTINRMLGRLEQSFDTQRRFTADASHELRTPVTAITGHANYLLRRSNPTQGQKESLQVIKSEAARMGKLVSDLLELARADAGFTVQRDVFNLLDVLEDVHKELAPMAGETHITISSSDLLMEVYGDANRLKQVALNLTQNALNAGAKHITLTLSHEVKQVDKQEKRYVQLEVLDDGPGIPSEAIPHLFERFYRVDGARKGTGSGLGLAIVKWIIDQHEGSIDVTSKVGEGTVFYVLLPAPEPHNTEA